MVLPLALSHHLKKKKKLKLHYMNYSQRIKKSILKDFPVD